MCIRDSPKNMRRPIVTIIMSNIKLLTDLQNCFTAGKYFKFATKQYITLGVPATPTVARFLTSVLWRIAVIHAWGILINVILLNFCLCFSCRPFLYEQTMGYDCPSLCPPWCVQCPPNWGARQKSGGAQKKNFSAPAFVPPPTFNLLPAPLGLSAFPGGYS